MKQPFREELYELRRSTDPRKGIRWEIYKLPSRGEAIFLAGVHGSPFRLIEHKMIKGFKRLKIEWSDPTPKRWQILESEANSYALLFRVLAPMKNIERIRSVISGIEDMREEEASYWMGMVLHRKKPARILMALRILLTTP